MAFLNGGLHVQEYTYDFAVDGGVKDANIVLSTKAGASAIPIGAVIKEVTAYVVTAPLGTSTTLAWGHSANADAYSGTTIAEATLAINTAHNSQKTANSSLWDDSNDAQIPFPITTAALGSFVVLISTANLTAGKVVFSVEYLYPTK